MSIVHRLEGCGSQVAEVKELGPDGTAVTVARELAIVHSQSDEVWIVRWPLTAADDIGGQLQGQPAQKHIDVAGVMPPAAALQQFRNGS